MKIGIPRGLLFFKYYPEWKTFLEALGHKVIISPETNKKILNLGLEVAENELCVCVKGYFGHVRILEKEKVEAIFIPRMVSTDKKGFTCPKLMGLPDMVRSFTKIELLSPIFNQREGPKQVSKELIILGEKLGNTKKEVKKAWESAILEQKNYNQRLLSGEWPITLKNQKGKREESDLTIGLAGHPYLLYDPYITLNLLQKLTNRGIKVLAPESVPENERKGEVPIPESSHYKKPFFWNLEEEILGTVNFWLREKAVDGIIYVLAFACGLDSIVKEFIEHYAKKSKLHLTSLVLDEHSGEAGLETRLEAFLDCVSRKKGGTFLCQIRR